MKQVILFAFFFTFSFINAQVNCLIYPENSDERKSCEITNEALTYEQGSKKSQMLLDKAILLNPKNDFALKEKSVPFLKRGFILEGMEILNKAVEANPRDNLDYRAYWFFALGNYKMCVEDLERYYALPNAFPYIYTSGGDMDMRLLLAMSYAKLNQNKKGLDVMKKYVDSYEDTSDIGNLDYYVLGMLYYKNGEFENAINAIEKQMAILPNKYGNYYYAALSHKALGNTEKAKEILKDAMSKFSKPDYYSLINYNCFKVYFEDLENEYNLLVKE
ncbi:tetratricopeptide repeat protein [Aureivirga marina]|uniref:tetratricopeptide repeat protein n=1 Tax=Aureivirga marina TaxID=1182451 RepID=UPI0018C9601B|nr:tetratricopeptide repeat protein [Aureivirga marina]